MAYAIRKIDKRNYEIIIERCTSILTAQLGYNVTKSNKFNISWSNTYNYPIKIEVYPIYSITKGQIWEADLFFDDYVGNFTAKRAIGDDIIVTKNK